MFVACSPPCRAVLWRGVRSCLLKGDAFLVPTGGDDLVEREDQLERFPTHLLLRYSPSHIRHNWRRLGGRGG